MAEPLLTKDSINIGGHKFPIALVGGLAAIATVVLVLRARQKGGTVAAVGQQPGDLSSLSGYGSQGFQPDYSAALANIQGQLSTLEAQQQGMNAASSSAATPASSTPAHSFPVLPPFGTPVTAQTVWGPLGPPTVVSQGWIGVAAPMSRQSLNY